MADRRQKPPQARQEPFVKLPRDLLRSDAWRSLAINERRAVDFLMLEHLSHGGRENGNLKAPYRQLVAFGICARFIADAIRGVEGRGLILCERNGMRMATTYTLTWLPTAKSDCDGKRVEVAPGHQWRAYRDADLRPLPPSKSGNLPNKGDADLPYKGDADGPNLPNKGDADWPESLPYKGDALSRRSYQDRGIILGVRGRAEHLARAGEGDA